MTARRRAALAPLIGLVAMLAACSTTPADAGGLTVTDPWVKAADSGMTAAFGVLVNDSDADITIVSATSSLSRMELHEMAMNDEGAMVMRPKEGGIVVPANSSHELAPGGDHVMFMDLTEAIEPGAMIAITLTDDEGRTWEFEAAARTFTGAEEDYEGGAAPDTEMGSGDS